MVTVAMEAATQELWRCSRYVIVIVAVFLAYRSGLFGGKKTQVDINVFYSTEVYRSGP